MVKNRQSNKRNGTKMPKQQKKSVVVKTTPIATTSSRKSVNKRIIQKGDVVQIHHRELLQATYVASSLYSVDSRIALNPGLSTYSGGSPMATWLPSIATNYDRYRFKSLKFHFRTYAATTTPGMIIMSYDPNPDNANPASLSETQNMHSIDGSVHENLTFDLTTKLTPEFKYVRTGTVVSLPNYDQGFVNFSSIGSSGNPVGIIEVEYVVEFKQPQAGNSSTPILPNIPVLPTQVLEATTFADGIVDTLYSWGSTFGNINAPMTIFKGSSTYGASLVSLSTVNTASTVIGGKWQYPNGSGSSIGTVGNCLFKTDDRAWAMDGLKRTFFQFFRSGRYKVRIEAPFDVNVNYTAAYQLFAYRKTASTGPSPAWSLPLIEAIGIDGTVSAYKGQRIHVQQGVQNAATVPQTAGDSTQYFEFEIAADLDDCYVLAGGAAYAVCPQTGDCALTARTSVTAPSRMVIQYLGPRLTQVGLYDI